MMNKMRKTTIMLSTLVLIFISGCQDEKLPDIKAGTNIIGLASGINLNPDQTLILLSDYFINPEKIEAVHISGLADEAY